MRPRLLDLFCGAGGAGKGYDLAGFDVVGVDIKPQPHYPFEFHQRDITTFDQFDVIGFNPDAVHASPPCQFAVSLSRLRGSKPHENLIPQTRAFLLAAGLPFVIENVPSAAEHLRNPITVCGYSLGLPIKRHRLFECSFPAMSTPCRHDWPGGRPVAVYGSTGGRSLRNRQRGFSHAERQAAMGIDWMTNAELTQAIPPAYTEHIGHYLLGRVQTQRKDGGVIALTAQWDRTHPFLTAVVSWYSDLGTTASGWHAADGFATCGTGGGPCLPFGARVEFCYARCVVATADDHGPYVPGRAFDLAQDTAGAIGFDGVAAVRYRVLPRGGSPSG